MKAAVYSTSSPVKRGRGTAEGGGGGSRLVNLSVWPAVGFRRSEAAVAPSTMLRTVPSPALRGRIGS